MNYKSFFVQLPVAIIIASLSHSHLATAKKPDFPLGISYFVKAPNYTQQLAILSTTHLEIAKKEALKKVSPIPPTTLEKDVVQYGYCVDKYAALVTAIDLELKKRNSADKLTY